jgi:hypothetical protein
MEYTIKLEAVIVKYLADPHNLPPQRPQHKENAFLWVFGGHYVDSIDFYKGKLHEVERNIYRERSKSKEEHKPDSSAFVAFSSVEECHHAYSNITHHFSRNHLYMTMTPALPDAKLCPEFDDIIWENVGNSQLEKKGLKLTAFGLSFVVTFFWFLVIVAAQNLSNIATSFNAPVPDGLKGIIVFLQSIVSPSIMSALNIVIVIVLRKISLMQGVITGTGVERSTLLKYYIFQIYQALSRIAVELVKAYLTNVFKGTANGDQFNALLNKVIVNFVGVQFV